MNSNSSQSEHRSINPEVPLLLTFCTISALLIYLVSVQNFVFGSDAGNWTYPYFKTIAAIPRWLPVLALTSLALLIYLGSRLIKSYEIATVVCSLVAVFLLQSLIRTAYPISMGNIIESDVSNSFYSPALAYSPSQILGQYTDLAQSLPLHARSNMPGKILFFQLFLPFTSTPLAIAYLIIMVSTSGALLLYAICKLLFHDTTVAYYALILYALIPARLFFVPILNTVTPVLILLSLWLFLLYLEKQRLILLWLLGGSLYFLLLFEPSPLVTGILFLAILLPAISQRKISRKNLLALFIVPVFAILGLHLLFIAIFSFNLLQAFRYVLSDAVNFNLTDRRDYRIWLAQNPKEFFYAVGLPIAMLFIYQMFEMLSQGKRLSLQLTRWSLEYLYLLGLLLTFLIVLFLGINRGEATRLWIYLAVLFQVPAAFYLAHAHHSRALFYCVAAVLVFQSIITLQRVGFVLP